MRRAILPTLLLLAAISLAGAAPLQPPAIPQPMPMKVFPRGHKAAPPEVRTAHHAAAFARHGHRVQHLPTATAAQFDCRAMGWVGPVGDQGQCGFCWGYASTDCITNCYIKAGVAKNDGSWKISGQYILDQCGPANDGCNGGWGSTVFSAAKSGGIPLESDYGPYTAHSGPCRLKAGTKLWKIADFGYATKGQEQGVSSTQDIKNCIVAFGVVATAIVADKSWDNYRGGVMPFEQSSPNAVDHEVEIVGFDDTKVSPGTNKLGAFLVRNQWGPAWGEKGYCWIPYDSHQIGTECTFVTVAVLPSPPPPPPPPPPPGPTPGPLVPFDGTLTFKGGVLMMPAPPAPAPKFTRAQIEQLARDHAAAAGIDWAPIVAALVEMLLKIFAAQGMLADEVGFALPPAAVVVGTNARGETVRIDAATWASLPAVGAGSSAPVPMPIRPADDIGFGIMRPRDAGPNWPFPDGVRPPWAMLPATPFAPASPCPGGVCPIR